MGLVRQTVSIARGIITFHYLVVTHGSLFTGFPHRHKQVSQSKNPLVHEVIPIFDIVSRALDEHVSDITLPPSVRIAASRGCAMLNKYYGLTDDSIVYQIAMCKS